MGRDPQFEKQSWFNTIPITEAQMNTKERAELVQALPRQPCHEKNLTDQIWQEVG